MSETKKQTNAEIMQENRRRYLANEMTHDQYYLWLSDFIGLPDSLIPATNERVKASKDLHLNDIPLQSWDSMDRVVRIYASRLPWSLSDTVCCLKAMAKRRASMS